MIKSKKELDLIISGLYHKNIFSGISYDIFHYIIKKYLDIYNFSITFNPVFSSYYTFETSNPTNFMDTWHRRRSYNEDLLLFDTDCIKIYFNNMLFKPPNKWKCYFNFILNKKYEDVTLSWELLYNGKPFSIKNNFIIKKNLPNYHIGSFCDNYSSQIISIEPYYNTISHVPEFIAVEETITMGFLFVMKFAVIDAKLQNIKPPENPETSENNTLWDLYESFVKVMMRFI